MKKIIFIYPGPVVGGSTTSLLSLLENIDYSNYDVSILFFFDHPGNFEKFSKFPVKFIIFNEEEKIYKRKRQNIFCYLTKIFSSILFFFTKKKNVHIQLMRRWNCYYRKRIKDKYDIAISYLENDATYYNFKYINAVKKICWIHVNYKEAGFLAILDKKMYSSFDKIAFVSPTCKNAFIDIFPTFKDKCFDVPNIVNTSEIQSIAKMTVDDLTVDREYINFLSCCRIDMFHKGLDRTLDALSKIQNKNQLKLRWYIMGSGKDFDTFRDLIKSKNLANNVFLLGSKTPPYPYFKLFDFLFVPSRYEGKPIIVEESLLCGLPVVSTAYSSAEEQINKESGIVIENSDTAILNFLNNLNSGKIMIAFEKTKIKSNIDIKTAVNLNNLFIFKE